jgi:hypothetical protein
MYGMRSLKIVVLWNKMPYGMLKAGGRFGRKIRLQLQGTILTQTRNQHEAYAALVVEYFDLLEYRVV